MQIPGFVYPSNRCRNLLDAIITGGIKFPGKRANGILFTGDFATGKSSVAMQLPQLIEAQLHGVTPQVYQATCEKGRDPELLTQLKNTIHSWPVDGTNRHYIVLDEIDVLGPVTAQAIAPLMDLKHALFIFTTNCLTAVQQRLTTRCIEVNFDLGNPYLLLPLIRQMYTNAGFDTVQITDQFICSRILNGVKGAGVAITNAEMDIGLGGGIL